VYWFQGRLDFTERICQADDQPERGVLKSQATIIPATQGGFVGVVGGGLGRVVPAVASNLA
jgi:hypothetical protein